MLAKSFMALFIIIIGYSYLNRMSVGSHIKEYNYTKLKATAIKEEAIKSAIVRYIKDTSTIPTIQDLVDNSYISSADTSNDFGGAFTFSVDRKRGTIDVNTSFTTSELSTKYAKLHTRTFRGLVNGSQISTKYQISTNFLDNIDMNDNFKTAVSNTAPDSSKYIYWIDTSSNPSIKKVYDSNSSTWKPFKISVRNYEAVASNNVSSSLSELNSTKSANASEGDIQYIYNQISNTIDEYVFYNDNWIKKTTHDD